MFMSQVRKLRQKEVARLPQGRIATEQQGWNLKPARGRHCSFQEDLSFEGPEARAEILSNRKKEMAVWGEQQGSLRL